MPERKGLNVDDLPEAAPRARRHRAAKPAAESWDSREPISEAQINVRGPSDVLSRFKRMCKDDRRTYIDMIRVLMDAYDGQK